jgi:hypothetical protein
MSALVAVSLFPNCFKKAKAGGHFLFFGQIAQTFIKCSILALAHNARPVYGDETEISELAQRY